MTKKWFFLLLVVVAFTSCKKEDNFELNLGIDKKISDVSNSEFGIAEKSFGQKTSHGDCRTHIEASYSHGYYIVSITNYTSDCSTYRISFPDGYTRRQTRQIQSGETLNYHYTAPFVHGAIIVTPNNQAPALCAFGSVQVNL